MKIYELYPDMDNYSSIEKGKKSGGEEFEKIYLQELATEWIPKKMKLLKSHKEGDVYGVLGGIILGVNKVAYKVLSNCKMGHIEYLPIIVNLEREMLVLNVLNHISVLDEDRSDIIRFPDNRIMMITKYVFQSNLDPLPLLFKLDNYKKGSLFATDEFKRIIEANNLTGLQFEEIWRE